MQYCNMTSVTLLVGERKLLTSHPKGQCSMNTERQIVLATTDVLCFARNLPQNRPKCLRRTFVPPRQKLALYDALKRAVKIL